MAEITREQVEDWREALSKTYTKAFPEIAGIAQREINALCDLALQALRQQEGMVLVDMEPTTELLVSMAMRVNHGFGLDDAKSQQIQLIDMRKVYEEITGQGFYSPENAERYAGLAASERDQRGAAAGDSEKPVAAVAKSEADREVCGTDTGPQSAPHPNLLREHVTGPRTLDEYNERKVLLRGIALGIEAAKQRCERYAQNFCDKRGNPPPREQSAPNYWEHRSAQMCASLIGNISPADIAAKNPEKGQP